jgi:hypothetical protein
MANERKAETAEPSQVQFALAKPAGSACKPQKGPILPPGLPGRRNAEVRELVSGGRKKSEFSKRMVKDGFREEG